METLHPPQEIERLQTGLGRLYYLRDTVFPHLENMPTIEDIADTCELRGIEHEYGYDPDLELEFRGEGMGMKLQGRAVLDFNVYCQKNTPIGFDQLPVTDEYNCSRQGCLAGWYMFMRDNDTEKGLDTGLEEVVRRPISGYSVTSLSIHFAIGGGQAQMLFGSLLKGAEGIPDEIDTEETLWSTSQMNVTKIALEERRQYLNRVIEGNEATLLAHLAETA